VKSFKLGNPINEIGQKALSWQQITAVILVCPTIVFAVLAAGVGSRTGSTQRLVGQYGLAVCLPLLFWLIVSHVRAGRRESIYPDVLAALFPPQAILQSGKCHFLIGGRQDGPLLLLHLLVQNLCAGPGELQLRFAPNSSPRAFRSSARPDGLLLADVVPPLRCDIPPSAVVLWTASVALGPQISLETTRLSIELRFRKSGRQVRFDRRRHVIKAVDAGLGAGLVLTGHFVHGGGTFLPIDLSSFLPEETSSTAESSRWFGEPLWSPDDPATTEQIAAFLAERGIPATVAATAPTD
jgi:hypothetical protein